MRTTKVSLVKRRGRGVVEREGEGRQQGTGPHHTSRKEKNERRSVWAATGKTICPSSYFNTLRSSVGFRACWQQAGAVCFALLTFWWNSGEFRPGNHQFLPLNGTQVTTNGREKGQHVIIFHCQVEICIAVSCRFSLVLLSFLPPVRALCWSGACLTSFETALGAAQAGDSGVVKCIRTPPKQVDKPPVALVARH